MAYFAIKPDNPRLFYDGYLILLTTTENLKSQIANALERIKQGDPARLFVEDVRVCRSLKLSKKELTLLEEHGWCQLTNSRHISNIRFEPLKSTAILYMDETLKKLHVDLENHEHLSAEITVLLETL